ncbi:MAG: hypothetical protein LCH87_08575 [Actinobacteria bacterium]|nr:hypothetical protein [Actinomycetota bacterium]
MEEVFSPMSDVSTAEIAELFALLGEEPAAIRALADALATLQAIQTAKQRLSVLPSTVLRAGLRERAEVLRP